MGFQAAAGLVAVPNRSQPFHGKSLSLTVRTKIGELKPAAESTAMFSTPWENSALKRSRLDVYPTTTRSQPATSWETSARSWLMCSVRSARAPVIRL